KPDCQLRCTPSASELSAKPLPPTPPVGVADAVAVGGPFVGVGVRVAVEVGGTQVAVHVAVGTSGLSSMTKMREPITSDAYTRLVTGFTPMPKIGVGKA